MKKLLLRRHSTLIAGGPLIYTYTIPNNAGGTGEGFYRTVASWTNSTGLSGRVNVNGTFTSATCEKVVYWQILVDGVSQGASLVYNSGGCSAGTWPFNQDVPVLDTSVVVLQVYLWGAYNSDHIGSGIFNINAH
jgi:hypothetical protein